MMTECCLVTANLRFRILARIIQSSDAAGPQFFVNQRMGPTYTLNIRLSNSIIDQEPGRPLGIALSGQTHYRIATLTCPR